MTFECRDLERALAAPELLPEAREHARVCAACRRALWLWGESPELWPRIRQALEAQQKAAKPRGIDWRLLAGIAAAILVAVSFLILAPFRPAPPARQDSDFLTEQTLKEVEQTETAYRASIDKLARLAEPRLTSSANPRTIADREKLLVLDSEISEVRSTVEHNRFNARLQTELAVLYREKQETLKEILHRAQQY